MESKLEPFFVELDALKSEDRFVNIRTIESATDAWIIINGRKTFNLCTNNYLGLANHSSMKKAAQAAIEKWGLGPAAVRTIAGTQSLHLELEARLAAFKQVEAAIFLQSGFCANQAAIPVLVGPEDVIFSDRLNHASIIDGARLSRARIVVYEHCDLADLERKIVESEGSYRRGLVITDGVFSMDGDIAPLTGIYDLAERYGLLTMVDDAHGEGVLGRGRGIVHHFNLNGKFDVEIGTFSKAFGVVSGAIAGKQVLIDLIRQKARPNLFSSACTPADTAACMAAISLLADSGLSSAYGATPTISNARCSKPASTSEGVRRPSFPSCLTNIHSQKSSLTDCWRTAFLLRRLDSLPCPKEKRVSG